MSHSIGSKRVRGNIQRKSIPVKDKPMKDLKRIYTSPDGGMATATSMGDVTGITSLGRTIISDVEAVIHPKISPPAFPTFQDALGLVSASAAVSNAYKIELGVEMLNTANKANNEKEKVLAGVTIARGVVGVLSSIETTTVSALKLDAIKTAANVSAKALSVLKWVSGILGFIAYALAVIPNGFTFIKATEVQSYFKEHKSSSALDDLFNEASGKLELRDDISFSESEDISESEEDIDELDDSISVTEELMKGKKPKLKASQNLIQKIKLVAPNTYAKLMKGERGPHLLEELKQECKKSAIFAGLQAAASITIIITSILSIFFSSGVAVMILGLVTILVGLGGTVVDGVTLIETLKAATKLGKRDLIIKVLCIIIGVISLTVSVLFAPSLAIAIAGAIAGAAILAVPVGSLAYLAEKERRLNKEKADQLAEDQEAKKEEEERQARIQEMARKTELGDDVVKTELNRIDDFIEMLNAMCSSEEEEIAEEA
ncbi:MAG: hypothetical protein S4CHLAM20_01100 [Chlamydiia bacterium]|nr:hypothetical protein [Chlamydiia bacterium]